MATKMNKKGQGFNLLMGAIVAFTVLAIVMVVGVNIAQTLGSTTGYFGIAGCNQTNVSNCTSVGGNVTYQTLQSFQTFTTYFTILALVIIAAVILYFLLRNLGQFGRGGSE